MVRLEIVQPKFVPIAAAVDAPRITGQTVLATLLATDLAVWMFGTLMPLVPTLLQSPVG